MPFSALICLQQPLSFINCSCGLQWCLCHPREGRHSWGRQHRPCLRWPKSLAPLAARAVPKVSQSMLLIWRSACQRYAQCVHDSEMRNGRKAIFGLAVGHAKLVCVCGSWGGPQGQRKASFKCAKVARAVHAASAQGPSVSLSGCPWAVLSFRAGCMLSALNCPAEALPLAVQLPGLQTGSATQLHACVHHSSLPFTIRSEAWQE